MLFVDRSDAGQQLARLLDSYRGSNAIVLGVPPGGVPVAFEAARRLHAPLDVWVVRKIEVPYHHELGLGAIAESGGKHLDRFALPMVGASESYVEDSIRRETVELDRRVRRFRGGGPRPDLRGRVVIVVDDGIATGGTVRAAVRGIRTQDPERIVVAVPVGSTESLDSLRDEVEDVVCVHPRPDVGAIDEWYDDFEEVTDDEVVKLLARANRPVVSARSNREAP